ncbi:hypothetical protein AGDE_00327, partial [Angomonas deanei]
MAWVFVPAHKGDDVGSVREIASPPKKLSQRAQDIMAARRNVVEQSAKRRHTRASKIITDSKSRRRVQFSYPHTYFYTEETQAKHKIYIERSQNRKWSAFPFESNVSIKRLVDRVMESDTRKMEAEQVVRSIQPIQMRRQEDGDEENCKCVHYVNPNEEALKELLNESALEEGFKRYLNLQPMQLANVEVNEMAEEPSPRSHSLSPRNSVSKARDPQRGIATLGGLWCTVQALREDGRMVNSKDAPPVRRVMRICGGQALGLPLRKEEGGLLDVRCYELLLFSQEQTSPSAVNYGSEGLTLGQIFSPPASAFSLTPRVVDDPVALKEYKKKFLSSKSKDIIAVNNHEDTVTFGDDVARYLTITLVTLNARQKYTIDLTLVMLPFRRIGVDGGKILAEIPYFSPLTLATSRRLQGVSLSFSTNSAFLSAYKALLWATECNIVDIEQPTEEFSKYVTLRVSATPSPLLPWSASLGETEGVPKSETFRGHAVDFAVLAIAPESQGGLESDDAEPLKLDDFIITTTTKAANDEENEGEEEENAKAANKRRRCSSIFNSTLPPSASELNKKEELTLNSRDSTTVVGLTPFGVIRRGVSQRTSEVFDVRVIPRNKARMMPIFSANSSADRTVKEEQEHILQQDVEAAILLEYVSRLPFQSRVYGVLVDDHRYYVFQEPWISALSLDQSSIGTPEREALECNPKLKDLSERSSIMSLKDFIHAVLHKCDEEAHLSIAQLLSSQLLLLLSSIHGKGILLGPCPPQRILVRIEQPAEAGNGENGKTKTKILSKNLQIFVPDIGVNTFAWSYERQQCGVLEYLSPLYVLEHMLNENVGADPRPWTIGDDWWTFLCINFELFAKDGSALLRPKNPPALPTATPLISKFESPVEILDLWKEVVLAPSPAADDENFLAGISTKIRNFVQERVLSSVSMWLDSWISTKGEEIEVFGTTEKRKKLPKAVPQEGSDRRMIGISLAAAYLQRNEASEASVSSMAVHDTGADNGENVLEEMKWVFAYREFFDSIVDQAFVDLDAEACPVHTPSLCLLSHPFMESINHTEVFDGNYELPSAAAAAFSIQMTKKKLSAALLAYRTRAFRDPVQQPTYPLMIAGSAYNAGSTAAAPLFLLSSPAFREGNDEPALLEYYQEEYDENHPSDEGLVFSPSNRAAQSPQNAAGPAAASRSRSQSNATFVQQNKLRQMYKPEELQDI